MGTTMAMRMGKNDRFRLAKQQLCMRVTFFLYNSLPSLHVYNVKIPNFMCPFYGVGEHRQKFSFSFSKLRYGPFRYNPRLKHAEIIK